MRNRIKKGVTGRLKRINNRDKVDQKERKIRQRKIGAKQREITREKGTMREKAEGSWDRESREEMWEREAKSDKRDDNLSNANNLIHLGQIYFLSHHKIDLNCRSGNEASWRRR